MMHETEFRRKGRIFVLQDTNCSAGMHHAAPSTLGMYMYHKILGA